MIMLIIIIIKLVIIIIIIKMMKKKRRRAMKNKRVIFKLIQKRDILIKCKNWMLQNQRSLKMKMKI